MNLTFKDRSEFLRGFLVLIRKDKVVCPNERTMALIIGKHFGFAEDFCLEAVEHLVENEFLSEDPPVFSSSEIAEYFIKECYRIMEQIHYVNESELIWLAHVAKVNCITGDKFPFLKQYIDV